MDFPIDDRFCNADTHAPFTECMVCHQSLIESGLDYFVERIFRRLPDQPRSEEVLFEYGMCIACADDLRKELSEESSQKITALFSDRVRQLEPKSIEASTNQCLITGKAIADSPEFSYHAHCKRDRIIQSVFPYAISDEGMDIISELLSQDTTEFLDGFKGKYFSGPPEIAELLNPKRLIFI